jgi:hypothetical protein
MGREVVRVDFVGAVDCVDEWFQMTIAGRAMHIVTAGCTPGYALCGRRVVRDTHPSDHEDGGQVCRACDRAADSRAR